VYIYQNATPLFYEVTKFIKKSSLVLMQLRNVVFGN